MGRDPNVKWDPVSCENFEYRANRDPEWCGNLECRADQDPERCGNPAIWEATISNIWGETRHECKAGFKFLRESRI